MKPETFGYLAFESRDIHLILYMDAHLARKLSNGMRSQSDSIVEEHGFSWIKDLDYHYSTSVMTWI
jgi:hypothetical protein